MQEYAISTSMLARCCWLICLLAPGCRFFHLEIDKQRLGSHGRIVGTIRTSGSARGPIYLAAFSAEGSCRTEKYCLAGSQVVTSTTRYELFLREGHYLLFAYEDENRNQDVDAGERGALDEIEVSFKEQQTQQRDLWIDEAVSDAVIRDAQAAQWKDKRLMVVGEQANLDHRRFGRKEAEAAVWRPTRALYRHPAGLFVLRPVAKDKIPVIYVHGMGGYAQEFRQMIEALPLSRFQPWVFQYPGGLPLRRSSSALRNAITEMAYRFDFETFAVVAHSMGGLIAREALASSISADTLCLVTVATPFSGVPSASRGVGWFPFVVPSWRDLDPNSTFIEQLFRRRLPTTTSHLLVDLHINRVDDGVIPIASQLRSQAVEEASNRRTYLHQHSEALAAEDVIRDVNRFIARCTKPALETDARIDAID